ncbi:MAG: hypothetical protein IPO07_05290 [Haliscomenobacter sp.]|nr:hypothetical protein [Haliscomenobacter sp.]MBK9488259.1 hypothetical protein [Haliscomenobacter sp.]
MTHIVAAVLTPAVSCRDQVMECRRVRPILINVGRTYGTPLKQDRPFHRRVETHRYKMVRRYATVLVENGSLSTIIRY